MIACPTLLEIQSASMRGAESAGNLPTMEAPFTPILSPAHRCGIEVAPTQTSLSVGGGQAESPPTQGGQQKSARDDQSRAQAMDMRSIVPRYCHYSRLQVICQVFLGKSQQKGEKVMDNPNFIGDVVKVGRIRLGYLAGPPLLMANLWHEGDDPADVPPLVSEWYCSICGDEGNLDCEHIQLLREHAPEMELSDAELDNDDAWEDWQDYNETVRAGLRGRM